jgi:hypothetical protein
MSSNIFSECSDKEFLEMYKDIIGSEELGIRPKTLDTYTRKLKDMYQFEILSQAIDLTQKLFYREVANRYFKSMKW